MLIVDGHCFRSWRVSLAAVVCFEQFYLNWLTAYTVTVLIDYWRKVSGYFKAVMSSA